MTMLVTSFTGTGLPEPIVSGSFGILNDACFCEGEVGEGDREREGSERKGRGKRRKHGRKKGGRGEKRKMARERGRERGREKGRERGREKEDEC